jgi:hypothetical protein
MATRSCFMRPSARNRRSIPCFSKAALGFIEDQNEVDLAPILAVAAAEDADERRFAGAVLADAGMGFPAQGGKINVVESSRGPEGFADPPCAAPVRSSHVYWQLHCPFRCPYVCPPLAPPLPKGGAEALAGRSSPLLRTPAPPACPRSIGGQGCAIAPGIFEGYSRDIRAPGRGVTTVFTTPSRSLDDLGGMPPTTYPPGCLRAAGRARGGDPLDRPS